jgi:hypothetical protein
MKKATRGAAGREASRAARWKLALTPLQGALTDNRAAQRKTMRPVLTLQQRWLAPHWNAPKALKSRQLLDSFRSWANDGHRRCRSRIIQASRA